MKVLNVTAVLLVALGVVFVGCNGTSEFDHSDAHAGNSQALRLSQVTPVSEEVPDTMANRRIEAKRYLEVCEPAEMMKDAARNMAANMSRGEGDALQQMFSEHLDMQKVERMMLDCMCNHFTAAELRALAEFYGSPVGKSAIAKFGPYMAEAMPQINRLLQDAMRNHVSSRR
jgi:hypothetical protein